MYRKAQVKESSISIQSKSKSKLLLTPSKQGKAHIEQRKAFNMFKKYQQFLHTYHLFKQLTTINSSLNSCCMHLKIKKQDMAIYDVPYILSEQVSVQEKYVQDESKFTDRQQQVIKDIKQANSRGKSAFQFQNQQNISSQQKSKQKNQAIKSMQSNKIVISIQLNQKQNNHDFIKNQQGSDNESNQNFTDDEQSLQNNEKDKYELQSTNKNSKIQFSNVNQIEEAKEKNIQDMQDSFGVNQNLRKTAHFSYTTNHQKPKQKKIISLHLNESKVKDQNQQNYNHLNKQLRSKKVQVLLKLQSEQETRKEKARRFIMQDKQYLNRLISKK